MLKISFTNAEVSDHGYGLEVNGKSLEDIISTALGTKVKGNGGYGSGLPSFSSNSCDVTVTNDKHFHDGYYWTYNSRKAFVEQFPYLTERQIEYALRKLIDGGYVITGNYNKASFDRTLWYAITKEGYSILQNCEMEETKVLNANNRNVEPIP